MYETKGPEAIENQPADRKLINQHPELVDPSLKGRVEGTGPVVPTSPTANPPADLVGAPQGDASRQVGSAPSERPPTPATPLPAASTVGAGNDSKGIPRPFGPGAGEGEKRGYGEARRSEAARRDRTGD